MTAAAIVCASCGAEPPRAGARCCEVCGSPLTEPDRHAEFKQVTVLFADVVGSMDIAGAVGAERLSWSVPAPRWCSGSAARSTNSPAMVCGPGQAF
jgi:hypothetical protein